MIAILCVGILKKFLPAFLLLILVLSSFAPAYSEELKAEEIIERCKAKLSTQEAVLHRLVNDDEFLVIAARNHNLEGEIVKLKHIIGKSDSDRIYLYYKPNSKTPALKLPLLFDDLTQEEGMAIDLFYAKRGKNTCILSTKRSPKLLRPGMSKRAQKK